MNLNIQSAQNIAQGIGANEVLDETPLSPTEAAKKLEFKLQQRPDADFLKDQNILKQGGNLAGQRDQLEKAMTSDKLSSALGQRPTPEEVLSTVFQACAQRAHPAAEQLAAKGILNEDEIPAQGEPMDKLQGDVPTIS